MRVRPLADIHTRPRLAPAQHATGAGSPRASASRPRPTGMASRARRAPRRVQGRCSVRWDLVFSSATASLRSALCPCRAPGGRRPCVAVCTVFGVRVLVVCCTLCCCAVCIACSEEEQRPTASGLRTVLLASVRLPNWLQEAIGLVLSILTGGRCAVDLCSSSISSSSAPSHSGT